MHRYEVGQLYHPKRTTWPEGAQYSYRAGAHELLLFIGSPTEHEVEAIRHGASEFALTTDGVALCLLWHFAPLRWGDAPYFYWLVPDAERTTPPSIDPAGTTRALLSVTLIDAQTGIIRALRATSWSPAFTAAMHQAIRRQVELGPRHHAYEHDIERLLSRPTASLVTRAIARTTGGE